MSQNAPYIVGICGGSGSGKTFLLHQLLARLPEDKVTLISQDNYYKPKSEQVHDDEGLVNYDHPESLNLNELVSDLHALVKGNSFEREEYTFNNPHITTVNMLHFTPAPIVVVEGLFTLYESDMRNLLDLKLFVDADSHVRLTRRLRRDTTVRGQTMEQVLTDYNKYVAPMYQQFILPQRQYCDVAISNNHHMYRAVDMLVHHLEAVIV